STGMHHTCTTVRQSRVVCILKEQRGAYKEQTVYVMIDRKEQSAAITQAPVNQGSSRAPQPFESLGAWHRGLARQCGGAMGLQHTSRAGMFQREG
ncbi:hypothetical protein HaLaN_11576, partial [Haematococcus lacustris]